jgi:hypothetical protein
MTAVLYYALITAALAALVLLAVTHAGGRLY